MNFKMQLDKKDKGKNVFASVAIKEVMLLSTVEPTGKKLTVDYIQVIKPSE